MCDVVLKLNMNRHALGKIHLSNIISIRSDQPHHPIKQCQRLLKIVITNTIFTQFTTSHLLHHCKILWCNTIIKTHLKFVDV